MKTVVYLDGAFWLIPYAMRPGQSPKDILHEYRHDWIWLGSPGWYHRDEIKRKYEDFVVYWSKQIGWYDGMFDEIEDDHESLGLIHE